MPGGLIALVSFGKQNIVINGNPQITYFYKTFKRHSHFSEENISIPLDGPQELTLDMPIRVRAKVQRFADLVRNISLRVRIPEIYSKLYAGRKPHEFQWIHQLGAQMIQTVAIYVGGSKIQEFTGEWLALRAQLDYNTDHYQKWQVLVGDTPEINNPASGKYAGKPYTGTAYSTITAGDTYPNVAQAYTSGGTLVSPQANNPSIPGQYLLIPLPFWFSEGLGNALPLIALEYHEVEIQITFQPLRNLYTVSDLSGYPVRYGYQNAPFAATQNAELFNATYVGSTDALASPQNFYVDYGVTTPQTEYFNLQPSLQVSYIYLADEERKFMSAQPLQYITTQVQEFDFQGVTSRAKFDLDAHNMVRRMIWFARRSDAITFRNDYLNCTNWKYADQPPIVYAYDSLGVANTGTSGTLLPGTQREILQSARILCMGNEIFEEKSANYFSLQQPYDNLVGAITGVVGKDSIGPLYVYSFATKGSDLLQPSGSLNVSVINNFQLEVNPFPLPPFPQYDYDFTIYVESVNFIVITSGMGSLMFAI